MCTGPSKRQRKLRLRGGWRIGDVGADIGGGGFLVTMLVAGAALLVSILSPLVVSLTRTFLHELRKRAD